MARKKKKKLAASNLKTGLFGLSALVLGVVLFIGISSFLNKSDYFKIKIIKYDPALEFINKRYTERLKGKSIFAVDLQKVQKQLSFRYPQVKNLRVVREFPNQISVVAKSRSPVAQTRLLEKNLTLDDNGVVLSTTTKLDKNLPLIKGIKYASPKIDVGLPLKGKSISTALNIIDEFDEHRTLAHYQIAEVNVANLSNIQFDLSNKLRIIVDRDNMKQKMELLSVLLAKGRLRLKEVKYIDLRFKEPIIGKK